MNQNSTPQLVQSIVHSMASVLRRTDSGFDNMLRLLDGIILACLFFMLVFIVLFGVSLHDKVQKYQDDLVRAHQRISDLARRIKWMKDEL